MTAKPIFKSISNALFNIQNRIRLEERMFVYDFEEKPDYYFLYSEQDHPLFYKVVRKLLLQKFKKLKSIPIDDLTKELQNLTFEDFTKCLLKCTKLNNSVDETVTPIEISEPVLEDFKLKTEKFELGTERNLNLTFQLPNSLPIPEKEVSSEEIFQSLIEEQAQVELETESNHCVNPSTIELTNDVCNLAKALAPEPFKIQKEQKIYVDEVLVSKRNIPSYASKLSNIMIYAPPHSGKSTVQSGFIKFNTNVHPVKFEKFFDTDNFFTKINDYKSTVWFTNMPNLLKYAKYSIAIVPSRDCFMNRCRARGLNPLEEWYIGLWNDVKYADVVVYSNSWLSCILDTGQKID